MGKAQRTRSSRQKLEQVRARQRAEARRRKLIFGTVAGVAVVAVVAVIAVFAVSKSGGSHEVMPAGVSGGTPYVQPAALTVPNTTGISGVVAYDTTGYPASSSNGPANQALGHAAQPGARRRLDYLSAVTAAIRGDPATRLLRPPDCPVARGCRRLAVRRPDTLPRAPGPDRRLLVGIPAALDLTHRPAAAAIRQQVPGVPEIHARVRSHVHRRYRYPAPELRAARQGDRQAGPPSVASRSGSRHHSPFCVDLFNLSRTDDGGSPARRYHARPGNAAQHAAQSPKVLRYRLASSGCAEGK